MPKTVSKDGEEGRCVEHEDHTDMGPTCAQGLLAGTLGGEQENCPEDEDVGYSNQDDIGDDSHEGNRKPVPDVDRDVCSGKPGNAYMLTICVRDNTCLAKWQPLQQENNWKNDYEAPHNDAHHDLDNDLSSQDGVVPQGQADSHVAIKCHG